MFVKVGVAVFVGVKIGVKVGVKVGVFVGVNVGVGVGGTGRIFCRCIKTSVAEFVSLGTRFVASESNAVYCPSAEMAALYDLLFACTPFNHLFHWYHLTQGLWHKNETLCSARPLKEPER